LPTSKSSIPEINSDDASAMHHTVNATAANARLLYAFGTPEADKALIQAGIPSLWEARAIWTRSITLATTMTIEQELAVRPVSGWIVFRCIRKPTACDCQALR